MGCCALLLLLLLLLPSSVLAAGHLIAYARCRALDKADCCACSSLIIHSIVVLSPASLLRSA
jgi:hypothetical protein